MTSNGRQVAARPEAGSGCGKRGHEEKCACHKMPTLSQMRYIAYLRADAGMSFGEWMGFKRRRREGSGAS